MFITALSVYQPMLPYNFRGFYINVQRIAADLPLKQFDLLGASTSQIYSDYQYEVHYMNLYFTQTGSTIKK